MVLSETIDDMAFCEGLYGKKFSQVPFSGRTTKRIQATLKSGKFDGYLMSSHPNGR